MVTIPSFISICIQYKNVLLIQIYDSSLWVTDRLKDKNKSLVELLILYKLENKDTARTAIDYVDFLLSWTRTNYFLDLESTIIIAQIVLQSIVISYNMP